MINITAGSAGGSEASQRLVSPALYLDHWAVRKISECPTLNSRFVSALRARNGTWALSWLNLAEFTKVTDARQARYAEDFLQAILPHVFFLEIDPSEVIRRENELLNGGPPRPPHADLEFLRLFVGRNPARSAAVTARDLFSLALNGRLSYRLDSLADVVVKRIEAMRVELDSNPDFVSNLRRLPSGAPVQQGTRFILRELVRALIWDRGTKATRNHAIDLLHAVVPVAYCDYVLLDKHWEDQVNRVRSRLAEAGISAPVGKVFSGKKGEVEGFLVELESGHPSDSHLSSCSPAGS